MGGGGDGEGVGGTRREASHLKEGGDNGPASQTLIVLSSEPEMILVPSGEYATERIQPLCALYFFSLSSSVAARHTREASAQTRWRLGGFGPPKRACIPDFDRLVARARDDLGAVGRVRDGGDEFAVRVLLFLLELECGCQAREEASAQAKEWRFGILGPKTRLHPRL